MKRSLYQKLVLAFLLVAVTVTVLVAIFLHTTNPDRLNRLVVEQQRSDFETVVIEYYNANGTLDGVSQLFRSKHDQKPPPDDGPPRPTANRRIQFGLTDANGIIVVAVPDRFEMGQRIPGDILSQGKVIEVEGKRIGVILSPLPLLNLSPEELAYLSRSDHAVVLAAVAAVLVALIVSTLMARTLTRPLRALTQAAHRIAGGDLEQQVTVNSRDEIGELAQAFNRMSREVAQANYLRRQMTADIAHELRTPLTVIAGYVEAMRDGVLTATPQRMDTIYTEIERLQRLVEDLRTLSRADACELTLNRQPLSVPALLQQALTAFQHQAEQQHIGLTMQAPEEMPLLYGDETRLMQVLENLLSNALHHTPAGGSITLRAACDAGQMQIAVSDTGQGIAPEDLPHIFERFYRADPARSEESGASGLGLAIARAIVRTHGGEIRAESCLGEGATLLIEFPAQVFAHD